MKRIASFQSSRARIRGASSIIIRYGAALAGSRVESGGISFARKWKRIPTKWGLFAGVPRRMFHVKRILVQGKGMRSHFCSGEGNTNQACASDPEPSPPTAEAVGGLSRE